MKSLLKTITLCSLLFTFASTTYAQTSYAPEASEVEPALTGTTIPNASVKTVDDETIELKKIISQKPTVLIFYRGGWCPYCNKHLAELQRVEQKLVDMGYQIMAVSPDRPEILKKSISKHDLDYTLLSDSPMNLTKAFGLAFKVDDKTVQRYKEAGIDLEKNSGYDHHLLPAPAVYLINPDGLITFQYVNPNYKTRIDSDVLLSAAKAYYPED
ncbi:peroxiredoxin-like family protein [Fodinibius saliphilus]|uniref:peroxiredoxin-like family protein n=1 Tax=Fodinibius saliphilus TaxID=1920650 RepID=UPI001109BE81|nr:peroxiredoxin-like family protein [Fodinibius saliphilus]